MVKNSFAILTLVFTALLAVNSAWAMRTIELKQPNSNKVVFMVRFNNGSIDDPAGKEGLTFATASLMAQGGAGGMSYGDIQDKMKPWAASYFAAVDKQVTTFTFQVPVDFVDEFYPLVKNVLLSPDFTEKDFSRVMKAQQNFVDQVVRASSDEDYSKFALEHQLFRGGNMQHLKQGTSESVKGISLDDIKAHYQKAFTRNNVVVGIAGNFSEKTLHTLKADLAGLPDAKFTPAKPSKANTADGIEVEIIAKDGAFGSAIFTDDRQLVDG
jgi:zinc protease